MAHRRHHYQNIVGSQEPTVDKSKFPITKEEASHLQSMIAKQHGGKVLPGSFAAKVQSTADKIEATGDTLPERELYKEMVYDPVTEDEAAQLQLATEKSHDGGVPDRSMAHKLKAEADRQVEANIRVHGHQLMEQSRMAALKQEWKEKAPATF